MANCEVDTNATILKTGSYGMVSLIYGSVKCSDVSKMGLPSFLSGPARLLISLGGERIVAPWVRIPMRTISHRVFAHRQLDQNDIGWLASCSESTLILTNCFSDLIRTSMDEYLAQLREIQRKQMGIPFGVEKPPSIRGKCLADLFQILPIDSSVRFLLAALNPERDLSIYIAEATVLLPRDARLGIFEEMAGSPIGRNGGAERFLRLITGQINSLTGAEFLPKLPEVREDLTMLGQRLH